MTLEVNITRNLLSYTILSYNTVDQFQAVFIFKNVKNQYCLELLNSILLCITQYKCPVIFASRVIDHILRFLYSQKSWTNRRGTHVW